MNEHPKLTTARKTVLVGNTTGAPLRVTEAGNILGGGEWAYVNPNDPVTRAAIAAAALRVIEPDPSRESVAPSAPSAAPKRKPTKRTTKN